MVDFGDGVLYLCVEIIFSILCDSPWIEGVVLS